MDDRFSNSPDGYYLEQFTTKKPAKYERLAQPLNFRLVLCGDISASKSLSTHSTYYRYMCIYLHSVCNVHMVIMINNNIISLSFCIATFYFLFGSVYILKVICNCIMCGQVYRSVLPFIMYVTDVHVCFDRQEKFDRHATKQQKMHWADFIGKYIFLAIARSMALR